MTAKLHALCAYACTHLTPHKVLQRCYVGNDLPKTRLIAQGSVRELFREEPDQ
jgi:hypothetical protein